MARPVNIEIKVIGSAKARKAVKGIGSDLEGLYGVIQLIKRSGVDLGDIKFDADNLKQASTYVNDLAKAINNLSPEQIAKITEQFATTEDRIKNLAKSPKELTTALVRLSEALETKGAKKGKKEIEEVADATKNLKTEAQLAKEAAKAEAEAFKAATETVARLKKEKKDLQKVEKESLSKGSEFAAKAEENKLSLVANTNRLTLSQSQIMQTLGEKVAMLQSRWAGVGNNTKEVDDYLQRLTYWTNFVATKTASLTEEQRRGVTPLVATLELLRQAAQARKDQIRTQEEINAQAKEYKGVLSSSNDLLRQQREASKKDPIQRRVDRNNAIGSGVITDAKEAVAAQENYNKKVLETNQLIARNSAQASSLFSLLRANDGIIDNVFQVKTNKEGEVEKLFGPLVKVKQEIIDINEKKAQGQPYDRARLEALQKEEKGLITQQKILEGLLDIQRDSASLERAGISTLEQRKALLAQIGFTRETPTGVGTLRAADTGSELGRVLANQRSAEVGVVGQARVSGAAEVDKATQAAREKVEQNRKEIERFAQSVIKNFTANINKIGAAEDEATRRVLGNFKRTFRSIVQELGQGNITLEDFQERLQAAVVKAFDVTIPEDAIARRLQEALGRVSTKVSSSVQDATTGVVSGASRLEPNTDRTKERLQRSTIIADETSLINEQSDRLQRILKIESDILKATTSQNDTLRSRVAAIAREERARRQIEKAGGVANLTDKEALKIAEDLVRLEIKNGQVSRQKVLNAKDYKARVLEAREALRELSEGQAGVTITDVRGGRSGGISDASQISTTQKQIKKTNEEMKGFGTTTLRTTKHITDFNEQLAIATLKIIRYRIAFVSMQKAYQTFSDAFSTARSIELGFARIAKVTDITAQNMKSLERSAFSLSKNFAQPIDDVINSLQKFAQAGFSLTESFSLTKAALLGVNGANLSLEDSTNLALAAMKIYRLEAVDVESVMDKLVAVQAANAVTATDLAQAIKLVGASAREVGLTLDDFNGIVTAIASVSRKSGREIGNSLKTMFARFTRPEPVQDLQKVLEDFDLTLFDSGGNLRDLGDILFDISKIWQLFTNTQKINIATTIGGTRRYSDFVVLMENYDLALKATNESLYAQGDALRANTFELSTLDAQMRILKTSFQESLGSLFKEDLFGLAGVNVYDITKNIVIGLNSIQEAGNAATTIIRTLTQAFLLFTTSVATTKLGSGIKKSFSSVFDGLRAGSSSNLAQTVIFPKEEEGIFGAEAKIAKRIQLLNGLTKEQRNEVARLTDQYKRGAIVQDQYVEGLKKQEFSAEAAEATANKLQGTLRISARQLKINSKIKEIAWLQQQKLTAATQANIVALQGEVKALQAAEARAIRFSNAMKTAGSVLSSLKTVFFVQLAFIAVSKGIEYFSDRVEKLTPRTQQLGESLKKSIPILVSQEKALGKTIDVAGKLAERYELLEIAEKEYANTEKQSFLITQTKQTTLNKLANLLPQLQVEYKGTNVALEESASISAKVSVALEAERQKRQELREEIDKSKIAFAESTEETLRGLSEVGTQARESLSKVESVYKNINKFLQSDFTQGRDPSFLDNLFGNTERFKGNLENVGIFQSMQDMKEFYTDLVNTIEANGLADIIDFQSVEDLEKQLNAINRQNLSALEREQKQAQAIRKAIAEIRSQSLSAAKEAESAWARTVIAQSSAIQGLLVLTETQKNKIKSSIIDPLIQIEQRIQKVDKNIVDFSRSFIVFGDSFDYNRTIINSFRKDMEDIINLRSKLERFTELEDRMKDLTNTLASAGIALDKNYNFDKATSDALVFRQKIKDLTVEISVLEDILAGRTNTWDFDLTQEQLVGLRKQLELAQSDLKALNVGLNELDINLSLIDLSQLVPGIENFPGYQNLFTELEELAKKRQAGTLTLVEEEDINKRVIRQMDILREVVGRLLDLQEERIRTNAREALTNEQSIQSGIRNQRNALSVYAERLELENQIASATDLTATKIKDRIQIDKQEQAAIGGLTKTFIDFIKLLTTEEKDIFGLSQPGKLIEGFTSLSAGQELLLSLKQKLVAEDERLSETTRTIGGLLLQQFETELKLAEQRQKSLVLTQKLKSEMEDLKTATDLVTSSAKEESEIRTIFLRKFGAEQSRLIEEQIVQKEKEIGLLLTQAGITEDIIEKYIAGDPEVKKMFDGGIKGSDVILSKVLLLSQETDKLAKKRDVERFFESISAQISAANTLMQSLASNLVSAFGGIPQQIIDIRGTIRSTNEQIVSEQESILELQARLNTEIEAGSVEWQRTQKEIDESREKISDLKEEIDFSNIALGFLEDLTKGINDAFRRANSALLQEKIQDALKEASFNSFQVETSLEDIFSANADPSGTGLVGQQKKLYDAYIYKIEQLVARLLGVNISVKTGGGSGDPTRRDEFGNKPINTQINSPDFDKASKEMKLAAATWLVAGDTIIRGIGSLLPSPGTAAAVGEGAGAVGNILGLAGVINPLAAGLFQLGGTLLGGLLGKREKELAPDPDIFQNTDATRDNTLAIKENTLTIKDLRSQLINAPANFSLPAFSTLGGGIGTVSRSTNNTSSFNSNINVTINGNATAQDADAIAEVVKKSVSDAYREQVSKYGFQQRIG